MSRSLFLSFLPSFFCSFLLSFFLPVCLPFFHSFFLMVFLLACFLPSFLPCFHSFIFFSLFFVLFFFLFFFSFFFRSLFCLQGVRGGGGGLGGREERLKTVVGGACQREDVSTRKGRARSEAKPQMRSGARCEPCPSRGRVTTANLSPTLARGPSHNTAVGWASPHI